MCLFYSITHTNELILFQLSDKAHNISKLKDNNNINSNQIINEILEKYLLLLADINNIFMERVLNNFPTKNLQAKIVELYLAQFEKVKDLIKSALNIAESKNNKYSININFE